jgi:hypothetical protein
MPSRTLSPRISTTVTVMSLLMTMLSFFFLDSTNIAAYPSPKDKMPFLLYWFPRVVNGWEDKNAPVKIPFPSWNQA